MKRKFPDGKLFSLKPKEQKLISTKVSSKDGNFFIPNTKIADDVYIDSGIYKVENNQCFMMITNFGEKGISVKFPEINIELNNFETTNIEKLKTQQRNSNSFETVNFTKPCTGNGKNNGKTENSEIKLGNSGYTKTEKINSFGIKRELYEQLRLEHLNEEERKQLLNVIKKYQQSFYIKGEKLTFSSVIKHKIQTHNELPIHSKSYRYPYVHKQEVQKQIEQLLDQNIIQPSNSPYSAPIWIVPKKDDASGEKKWRLVIDYRGLNNVTVTDKYPIPNICDILDKLGRSHYFTTLDLASGFHQLELDPRDTHKTAFSVDNGKYEFLRLPFGLKNSPATFQRVMDNVLRGTTNTLVYMDDIICYGTSLQEATVAIAEVFERLQQFGLKIQPDKSEFLKKQVCFLGHIISEEGVKPNPNKVNAIKNWPIPENIHELRGFLGALGYWRKFIKDFAAITKPMTIQLKKNEDTNTTKAEREKITHTPEFIESFEKCKEILTSSTILQYPDFNKPFSLFTDASDFAIGACLTQGPSGGCKPIAFASRTLNTAEQKYSVIEKECLAIVYAVKYFRCYLYGRKFFLYCDHKPLSYVFNIKDPSSRLVRWRLTLEEYDYEVRFIEGRKNCVADGLSRIRLKDNEIRLAETDINTVHSADTDDTQYIATTQKAVNTFSHQIIILTGEEEINHSEEIFSRVFRKTFIKPSFTENHLAEIMTENIQPKILNVIYCDEKMIQNIQEIYKKILQ